MKNCEIVKDLLPLYAEDMASEESSAFVKEHLEGCESCRAALDELKKPVRQPDPAAPLKTVRRAVKKRGWLIAGLIACLVAALLLAGFARLVKPIPLHSTAEAFSDVTIEPETIPIAKEQSSKTDADPDTELVKQAQQFIVIVDGFQSDADESQQIGFVLKAPDAEADETPKPNSEVSFVLVAPNEKTPDGSTYMYVVPGTPTDGETVIKPDTVTTTPQKLLLTANPKVQSIAADGVNGEVSVCATTTLWRQWFGAKGEPVYAEIDLSDVDAVFFEPYNNTERETLYQREGYEPEAGFALPRLVMNYYFLIALAGTVILGVVWLVLLLTKKKAARRVFDILLILAGSLTLAFLAAGFPATTIAPVRELGFVLVIALLLIGAGLCGRGLLRKE